MELDQIRNARAFYNSWEWCELRYQALRERGRTCECCGIDESYGAIMTVDHVLPRSIWPEHALDPDNLQILCFQCNRGKGNSDSTDFRLAVFPPEEKAANDECFQLKLPLERR